ncbi:hypothetical protein EON83_11160 [bacterium]|nr:MAG: hypothetical protein EON83_11160 [bacterium]
MNIPQISRAEVEARRKEDTVDAAVGAVMEQMPMRERMRRGTAPAPAAPSRNNEGEAYFTFGNSFDDEGSPLAP